MKPRGLSERPRAISTLALAVVLAGTWSAARLPVEWVPRVELPVISLSAAWPGTSPQAVERWVTAPLERSLEGVAGTAGLESRSSEGFAFLRLEVSEDQDLGLYAAELSDRVAALRPTLPEGVVPRLDWEVPEELKEEQSFMTLELAGDAPPLELRRLADEIIAPRLRSLPGVAGVNVEGGEKLEWLLAFREDRLRAHHLDARDLRGHLGEALVTRSHGWLEKNGSRTLLISPAVDRPGELARLPIGSQGEAGRSIALSELAHTELGAAPVRALRRIDGQPAITFALDRAPGSDLLDLSADVREELAQLTPELPAGLELRVADDRSEDVRIEVRDLALRAVVGLLAIVAVLAVLLGSLRAAAVVLATGGVALAAAFVLMRPLGLTLNLFTLAGLVLLVGVVVDNAAIFTERLLTERERSTQSPARTALRAIWPPLWACTATTAVVLLPMVYLSGELRALFEPFALLATLTLGFSLLSTALLVPALGSRLPARRELRANLRKPLLSAYAFAGRYPKSTLVLLGLALGLPTPLLPERMEEPPEGWATPHDKAVAERYNASLGSEAVRHARRWLDPLLGGVTRPFLDEVEIGPSWDFEGQPEITVWLKLPTGSGLERTDELIRRFEERAVGSPDVERTLTRVSEDLALLRVLYPREALERSACFHLREELIAEALQLAGVEVAVSGLLPVGFYSGLGQVSGLPVMAYGPSHEGLQKIVEDFAARLELDPRVAGVDLQAARRGLGAGRESLRLGWGAEAIARTGLATHELTELLRPQLVNHIPTLWAELDGLGRVPVRMTALGAENRPLRAVLERPLVARTGHSLRLAEMAEIEAVSEPAAIEREDQQYRRLLRVYYRGPYRMGRDLVDRELAGFPAPPGYRLERPSSALMSSEVQNEFLLLIAGCAGLIFLVVAAVLESWRLAFWALASLPLVWVGIAPAFLAVKENFAEGAFFGAVLTLGLAANASILLVARWGELQREEPEAAPTALALEACRDRLRPLWTTTFTTLAGLLPLLLIPGAGAFWVGFALTVVGGLVAAALLVPAATIAFAALRSEKSKEARAGKMPAVPAR